MKQLFGTDGIRGVANAYPMTVEMAVRTGRAVASFFGLAAENPSIIVGRDTRLSGDMLESAIVAGICSSGANAYLTGVLPTPGVAFATSSFKANAGIVISASHNPYYDNGIKIFKGDGRKLCDEDEAEIEKRILDDTRCVQNRDLRELGTVRNLYHAGIDYRTFLKDTLRAEQPFKGLKIALDCSNGATYRIAPDLFSELGAVVFPLSIQPNGININDHCGSEHPEKLIEAVVVKNADVGLAFDGDGDRLIAVDETGKVLSGDPILAICAKAMKQKGTLKNNLVISTVMSNMGLGVALERLGIEHKTSQVGDRYVVEQMIASGAVLGGEDSGHMIFFDHHGTGDGMLTALKLLEAMLSEKKPLSELSAIMKVYPQVLVNVKVNAKPNIETVPEIMDAIRYVESKLGDKGRVLVRYSGTQPFCRVMVEGPDETDTRSYCHQLSDIIDNIIGENRRTGE
jgi:phosphoglucosamine mutase